MATHDSGGQARSTRQRESADAQVTDPSVDESVTERNEKLSEDVDAILDDIDEVLETNSEEFVRSFVQKGGQ